MFYVYELVVIPDGTVCYVGKGSGRRASMHKAYALRSGPVNRGRQKHLILKLKALLASGKDFEHKIVYETEDETEALRKERDLIEHYGFQNLFNLASHAFLGRSLKYESKTRVSTGLKQAWSSGKYKNRSPRRNLGRKKMVTGWFPKTRTGATWRGVSKWSHKTRPGHSDRWIARITENGICRVICNTTNFNFALRAYDDAAERLHGVRPNGT